MDRYFQVVFNLPISNSFTYRAVDDNDYQPGMRVEVPFKKKKVRGYIVGETSLDKNSRYTIHNIYRLIDIEPLMTPALFEIAEWIAHYYLCSLGEALATIVPPDISHTTLTMDRKTPPTREQIILTDEQQRALHKYTTSDKQFFYLYGVTGSGKGELIMHIAQHALQYGGVIILNPEISLAMQTAELLKRRLGIEYALIHSRLTNKERITECRRVIDGKVRLVVGARSAIFAPLDNIQLIIIDEEQEGAYKSNHTPRYHARHIAFRRARQQGCKLLFASATPSLEAWQAIQKRQFTLLSLPTRAIGQQPAIEVIPMHREKGVIGNALYLAMKETLHRKKQILLLHNRRGYGYALVCRSCGETKRCSRCSVALIYHKSKDVMVCHYCGLQEKRATICHACASADIGFIGFGTELVEQEIRRLFPHAVICRVDADSMAKRSQLGETIQQFSDQKIDILVGTQMIAKGLNFRHLELVGIVLADMHFTLPDFRAEELACMLFTQVAGRTGRYHARGKVLIQTYRPKNRAISATASAAFIDFYNHELAIRKELLFPPYNRMIRIVMRGRHEEKVRAYTVAVHTQCVAHSDNTLTIFQPQECMIAMISNNYRYQIILLHRDIARVRDVVERALASVKKTAHIFVEIDIDPTRVL